MATRRLVLILALVGLASLPAFAAAPDISLSDLDGQTRNVNQYIGRGKWVAVVAWAHDCGICAAEIHEMVDFHRVHAERDAMVLGVSIDGVALREQARRFVAHHRLPFVNLIAEPRQEVMQKFGGGQFVGTPTVYLYEPGGSLVAMNVGPVTRAELEMYIQQKTTRSDIAMAGLAP